LVRGPVYKESEVVGAVVVVVVIASEVDGAVSIVGFDFLPHATAVKAMTPISIPAEILAAAILLFTFITSAELYV
jgi:hypothetical protein